MARARLEAAAGRRAATAALRSGALRELLIAPGAPAELVRAAQDAGIRITRISRVRMDRAAGTPKHQNVVAMCAARPAPSWRELALGPAALLLAFDGVQDPRNLGACLRSAAAFGAQAAVQPRRGGASLTPTARKAAAGGDLEVPLEPVANLARELRAMSEAGLRIVGADERAETPLHDAGLAGPVAWVFGSEGEGLRRLTREMCDELVRIPLPGAHSVGSLNVAVACGICLAETVRQRMRSG